MFSQFCTRILYCNDYDNYMYIGMEFIYCLYFILVSLYYPEYFVSMY